MLIEDDNGFCCSTATTGIELVAKGRKKTTRTPQLVGRARGCGGIEDHAQFCRRSRPDALTVAHKDLPLIREAKPLIECNGRIGGTHAR